jgi:hypothetical protein
MSSEMSRPLRHIAIYVEEPGPGRYAWVLIERESGGWQALERSAASVASYHTAMARGLAALERMVPNLDEGPRADDEQSGHRPRKRTEAKEPKKATADPPANPASRSKKSYFGFGPAQ